MTPAFVPPSPWRLRARHLLCFAEPLLYWMAYGTRWAWLRAHEARFWWFGPSGEQRMRLEEPQRVETGIERVLREGRPERESGRETWAIRALREMDRELRELYGEL